MQGRLIGVNVNGTQQRWTVFDGSNVDMDLNGTGTAVTQRYVSGPGAYSTLFARVSATGASDWYVTDNLGSIRLIVDTSGNVLDAIVYDPWGNIVSESNPSNGDRFKFAGGQYDSIQQTYLFTTRWDNPHDGRWESQDPLGFESEDSNLYRYVNSDPITYTDPSGLIKVIGLTKHPESVFGSFDVKWEFVLSKPAPEAGYIVQQVTFTVDYKTCAGVPTNFKKVYWEAWFVKKGQTKETTAADGYTDHAREPSHPGTCGTIIQEGEIKFFYKRTTGNLGDPGARPPVRPDPKTGWGLVNAEPMAGNLPSTKKEPRWWGKASDNGEGIGTRIVRTDWSDCSPTPYSSMYLYPSG